MPSELLGMGIMVIGAAVCFLSNRIAKLFGVENPKASIWGLLIKVAGLLIAIVGMLVIMKYI